MTKSGTESAARVSDIEFHAASLDCERAAAVYREQGCLVVRGLMSGHAEAVRQDVERAAARAISLLPRANRVTEGWVTPDGTLFLPAPAGYARDKQIMVLAINYSTSGALFRSALEPALLPLLTGILGPDVELFGDGQCLYKEPVGGHPKHLHQDSAYFEHRFDGPVGCLTYLVPTGPENGCLFVAPGSHRLGRLQHVDTFSHLGLSPEEWPWERALPIPGEPGDAILFHVRTVHGSQENWSRSPRPVVIHRYRRADDFVTVSATTAANRAEAEKHEAEATKENQCGLMVCGYRDG